jgi:hypothetical protein
MPGLVPGIHVLFQNETKTWMAGTSPAMTYQSSLRGAEATKQSSPEALRWIASPTLAMTKRRNAP